MTQQVDWCPDSLDIGRPSPARMYDYILGGGHNLEADRILVEKLLAVQPEIRRMAFMNRAFLRRAVLFMMDAGIRQFLDLGSGILSVGNVHEIAQEADPECRVVYVDREPVAVAHSQFMLRCNDRATILQADVTEPYTVLQATATTSMLDFDRPVGVLGLTIGQHICPRQDPAGVFARYRDRVASGSHLAIAHVTSDFDNARAEEAKMLAQGQIHVFPRSHDEILEFFGDFDLVEPGLVSTSHWRPEAGDEVATDPALDGFYAGVARKP